MLRAVLDTNVLLSALIGTGKPRELWRAAVERKFVIIVSKELLAEFLSVVEREKFRTVRKRTGKICEPTDQNFDNDCYKVKLQGYSRRSR